MCVYKKDKETYFSDIPDFIKITIAYELIFNRYHNNYRFYSVKQVNRYLKQCNDEINIVALEIIDELNDVEIVDEFVRDYLKEHYLFCYSNYEDDEEFKVSIFNKDGNRIKPKGKSSDLELIYQQEYFTDFGKIKN
jgi:hypothetical protein